MQVVAYLSNSSIKSGVGHRADRIKQQIIFSNNTIKVVDFNLDGQRGLLSKNNYPLSWVKPWPGPLGRKSINWLRLGRKLNRCVNFTDKNQYDVYHATNQSLSWLAHSLKPFIVTVHDIIELTDTQDKYAQLLNRYLYRGIAAADHIITVSNYSASEIKKYFTVPSSHVTVIPNGVGPEFHYLPNFDRSISNLNLRKKLKLNPATKVVLFVGSDHPRKNVRGALRAFSRIKSQLRDVVFVKVGAPGLPRERERLLNLIDKLSQRDSVRLLSGLSDNELNDIYNMSDILLFPSRHEGFGLPLIQAMACGLPIVATNTTAIPEVTGAAAILVDANNTSALAESSLKLIQDQQQRERLIQRGLKRAGQFSWSKAAAQVAAVYQKTVDQYSSAQASR